MDSEPTYRATFWEYQHRVRFTLYTVCIQHLMREYLLWETVCMSAMCQKIFNTHVCIQHLMSEWIYITFYIIRGLSYFLNRGFSGALERCYRSLLSRIIIVEEYREYRETIQTVDLHPSQSRPVIRRTERWSIPSHREPRFTTKSPQPWSRLLQLVRLVQSTPLWIYLGWEDTF